MKLDDDDFSLFGLPRQHALDRVELDSRWRALQAQAHPDRFSAEGTAAQRVAMQWAMRINQAHQRLKDPLARAAYLCELRGVPIDAERNTAMPAGFLQQQMAWREALDEAVDEPAVLALDQQVAAHEAALLAEIGRLLDGQGDAVAAAAQVRALMFLQKLRADLGRRLENFES
jgi:molecular chaperone HscB